MRKTKSTNNMIFYKNIVVHNIMYKNKLYSFGEIIINKFSLTIEWPLDSIWLNDD